jgi:diaminopropionate ammonia-lyase
MAAHLHLGSLHIKDESTRLGLGSFKALGGVFAVLRVVLEEAGERLGRTVRPEELMSPEVRAVAREVTVCCATDGNYGRAVAAGARFTGCGAVIFIHATVSAKRTQAIEQLGARIQRVEGSYQSAVTAATLEAEKNLWKLVSDTSWAGYERIPRFVSQGYTAILQEVIAELPGTPSHVFVQAGVGGFASAVAAHFASVYGGGRPKIIVVEPSRAACIYESVRAGHPVALPCDEPTIMAMLNCQRPSLVAWRVLSRIADVFMIVEDEDAIQAMRLLARPRGEDLPVVAGESGGAGLAGLFKAHGNRALRESLALGVDSTVLLFNTEGAIDPDSYRHIVGASPDAVLRGMRARAEHAVARA